MAMTEHLDLTMPGGRCDAIRALPADGGRTPAPPVLFLMDAVGLRPRLEEMVATVADLGYAVLAPNVYYRAGRQPLIAPELLTAERDAERHEVMFALMRGHTSGQWADDGPACLDHLARWDAAAAGPVRVVGYCMGGRLGVLLAAAAPDRVACAAAFHTSGLVADAPDSAHTRLGPVRCPLYLGYADQDQGATPRQQLAFRDAARDAGVELVDETYAGARHGFTMADLPAYDAQATARHWEALRTLFARAG